MKIEQDFLNQNKQKAPNVVIEKKEKIPEDFKAATITLLKVLEKKQKTAEEGYIFTYGSFIENTSTGKKINIDTLNWSESDGYTGESTEKLVLIARDVLDNKVIGLRLADMKEGDLIMEGEKYIRTVNITGEILTRFRGKGIATALDVAFVKTLNEVSNEYEQIYPVKHQLNWKVENRHLERIEEAEKKDLGVLNGRKEEQERWQALYGEGGKFGLKKIDDYNYSKIIRPNVKEGVSYKRESMDIEKFNKIKESLMEITESGF